MLMDNVVKLEDSVPYIHNRTELKSYLQPIYIIDNYMVDKDSYEKFINRIANIIRGCFPIKSCREYPVKFKFYSKDKNIYELQLRHFFINIILWEPFKELHGISDILNESYICDCNVEIPDINDYINEKIIHTLREYNVKSTTLNYDVSKVSYNLRHISIDFSQIMGLNFSLNTFLDDYKYNDELRDMMEVTFDQNMQPHDIEVKLNELQHREVEIYKNIPNHPIGVLLRANTGVKHKQLTEFTIADGLFPTLNGVTITEPIENSLLIKGFDRPSYLYIAATGSRKSLNMIKLLLAI